MPDAADRFALRLERSVSGLARLGGWVDQVVATLVLPAAAEYALRLCVEEAVANVVMHGTPAAEGDASTVALGVDAGADVLLVTIEDRCAAFNPLAVPVPERPASGVEARVGGLGVHLMRQYARSVEYARVGGVNRLMLTIGRDG